LGIAQNNASGSGSFDYNSVYVGGTQSGGASSSYAFLRQVGTTAVLTDNLLFNERSGGSGGHYAVGSTVAGNWTSDHNVLIAANPAQLGQWVGADEAFAPWQSASGGDAVSLSETSANVPSAQLFTSVDNGVLDIKPTTAYDVPPIVSNAGTPVAGITTDFGGSTIRNASYPDIGANEITVSRTLTAPGSLQPVSASYPGNYDALTVTGGGAPNLTGDVDVFDVLSLGGGNVTTNAYSMTIRPSGGVSRTSGHVAGNLRKYVAAGGGTGATFEIGTGTAFAPVDVQFNTVATAGYLQATTIGTDHPNLSTSGIDVAKSANRYWTLTNLGTGFNTADVTLHFASGDLDAGADPGAFMVGKFDSPNWSSPATGLRTPTSTQATGVTSFSDFAVGDPPSHTLIYAAGPNGSISGTTHQEVVVGGSGAPVTAVPDAGYHFVSWSDGVLTATRTDVNVMADLSVTASFETNGSTVSVGAAPGMITLGNPVRTVPVNIVRANATPMLGFSVVFSVSSPLAVYHGMGGIHEGTYLSSANPTTSFNLIDDGVDGSGNHTYEVDGTTLGAPCGSSAASGTLFTIDLSSAASSGSGTVTITSVKLRDCGNANLAWVIGSASTVSVDQSAPSVEVTAPNGGETWHIGSLQTITWTGSDPEGITSYDLAYSTNGGSSYPNAIATAVPGTQASYAWTIPAAAGTAVRVRVTAHDVNGNPGADASDANFTIAYYLLTYTAGAHG
ncbi:MAG: hypothetical protein ACHQDE_06935, partial [Acidimicrobiia bacterium]